MRTIAKSTLILALRNLRRAIEDEAGSLTDQQVLLLSDVCQALHLQEAETNYILGDAYGSFVAAPIAYLVNNHGPRPIT